MAAQTLRRVEGSKGWARDTNPLIDAHLGNHGAQRLWIGWDGVVRNTNTGASVSTGNYSDVIQNTAGNHLSVRHSAGSGDSAADQVLGVNDDEVRVGRGKELRLYNAAGTNYANLKHSGTNDLIKTDDSLQVAVALSVGATASAADAGDIFASGGISVGVYSNPSQGEVRFGNNAAGLGYVNATTSAAVVGSISNIPLQFATNSTARIQLEAAGHMRPEVTNTYDLGASSYGWKDVYVAGRVGVGVAPSVALHVSKAQAADYVAILDNTSNAAGTKGLQIKSAGSGAADPVLNVEANSAQILNVFSAGLVGIGASPTNSFMTAGLTIDQGANDDQALALNSSDVAHGMTTQLGTSTYGTLYKQDAAAGGLRILGASEATICTHVQGFATTEDSTRSTSGVGSVMVSGFLKSGTGVAAPSANVNLFVVRSSTSARFILDSDGDSHQDAGRTLRAAGGAADDTGVGWTNYDSVDDVRALNALAVSLAREGDPLREAFLRDMTEHRAVLEAIPGKPIVTFNDGPDGDGHAFINMSRLTMLLVGAARQVAGRLEQQAAHIDALTARLHALEAG